MKLSSYGRMLLFSCFIAFFVYFASYMRFPVLPLFARSIGLRIDEIGTVNAVFFLTAGILSLPLGIVSDRIGRRFTASAGTLLLSISAFLLYNASGYSHLLGVFFLFGVGIAAFGPTMMSSVADFSPRSHLGRTYGWYTTALYTAMSIGPAAGGYMAQVVGLANVFLISAIISFVGFSLVVIFFPRRENTQIRQKHFSVFQNTTFLLANRPLLGSWVATLGGCFGLGMFITFMPLHCQNNRLPVGQIGLIFLTQGFFNAACRIPFGRISDKVLDRRRLVVFGIGLVAVSMMGLGFSAHILSFLVFAGLLGIAMAIAFTSIGALIAEMVDDASRGLAMGGYNACIFFGMMASSGIMGDVIQVTGFEKGFLLSAAASSVAVVGFLWLSKNYLKAEEHSR